MTFQQLLFAVEVANCVSIREAAEKLYTHQSNVSIALKQLEDEFGIRIFSRTKKGIKITPEGEEFLTYARDILQQKAFIESIYSVRNENLHRRFTLSSMRSFFLVEFARYLHNSYHDENILDNYFRLVKRTYKNVFEDVANNRAEMGIVFVQKSKENKIKKIANNKNLDYFKLGESQMNLIVRDGHPMIHKSSLEGITDYPYVLSEEEENFSRYFDESTDGVFDLFKETPSMIISTNDSLACEEIVAETDAFQISSVPRRKTPRYNCVSIPFEGNESALSFYYILRKNYELPSFAKGFIGELKQFFEEYGMMY